jgi:PEP-CTERM motif
MLVTEGFHELVRDLLGDKGCMKPILLVKVAASVVVLTCAGMMPANAELTLTLNDGNGNITNLSDSGSGAIIFNGSLSNSVWGANVDFALAYPDLGSQAAPEIDFGLEEAYSTAPGTLTFLLTSTGFGPLGSDTGNARLAIGGSGGNGSVTTYGLVNGSTVANLGPFTTFPWSGEVETNVSGLASTFSIGEEIVITHTMAGWGQQGDFDFQLVPEPSAFALAAIGLAGLLVAGRCRKRPR